MKTLRITSKPGLEVMRGKPGNWARAALAAGVATALFAVALAPPTGADHPSIPTNVLATAALNGPSHAGWLVHHDGGHAFVIGVEANATIAPDAGAISWAMWVVESVERHAVVVSLNLVFDSDADRILASSSTGLLDLEMSTYAGPPGASLYVRAVVGTWADDIPPADYYVVAMLGQDGGPFSGEFRLLSDDATVIGSSAGEAFYVRDRDYPAVVNAAVDRDGQRVRHIELGVVEKEVGGTMFAMFSHLEPVPAPIWFDQTDGFWVEGPGIDGPVEGTVSGVDYLDDECEEFPDGVHVPYICNIGPAIEEGTMAGHNHGTFVVSAGPPGTYRFRVDHWNVYQSEEWPFFAPKPMIVLLGADVDL